MNNHLCQYYLKCGGCSLQHLSQPEYKNYKKDILINAVKNLNLDSTIVMPLKTIGARQRRRVEFKITVYKEEQWQRINMCM